MREIFLVVLSACLTAYLTAKFMEGNDDKNREADIINSRRALAKAIHAELVNFREKYNAIQLSPDLPWNGEDIPVSYISQKYITVYESQLNKLGLLSNDDIPHIVKLYIFIKALIDSRIRLNDIREEYIQYTQKQITDSLKSPYNGLLDEYKVALRYQAEVYKLYPAVLDRLAKYDKQKEEQE